MNGLCSSCVAHSGIKEQTSASKPHPPNNWRSACTDSQCSASAAEGNGTACGECQANLLRKGVRGVVRRGDNGDHTPAEEPQGVFFPGGPGHDLRHTDHPFDQPGELFKTLRNPR